VLKLLKRQRANAPSWIIFGLGNPGPKYERNRHNVGQSLVRELAADEGAKFDRHRSGLEIARLKTAQGWVLLALSRGFMNLSGESLPSLLKLEGCSTANLIVVHDELDLPLGAVRGKLGGGHAGHNGLRDIISRIGADFHRIRIGIGRPPASFPVADFVLANFTGAELEAIRQAKQQATSLIWELTQTNS
jgi:PTH1 family peptidyl-tRNA hydrolase